MFQEIIKHFKACMSMQLQELQYYRACGSELCKSSPARTYVLDYVRCMGMHACTGQDMRIDVI